MAHSADVVAGNLRRLKAVFPEAFTEGKIDFAVLKQLLGNEKEKLPSLDAPLRFLFSHSALRQGWEYNPNVFRICTLRDIRTERERRQTMRPVRGGEKPRRPVRGHRLIVA